MPNTLRNNAYLPLAKLTEVRYQAAESGTLVTASDRLRREYAYAYDHVRMSAGDTAWREPSISGLDALLRRNYERARLHDPDCPKLLSALAEHALFRAQAPEGLAHLTALFEDAWQLVHAWDIDFTSSAFDVCENTLCFKRWAVSVSEALAKDGLITSAQLASQKLPDHTGRRLHLTGFDVITPQQQQCLERLTCEGLEITIEPTAIEAKSPSCTPSVQRFPTDTSELTAAICWAKDTLEAAPTDQPPPRIAIVVPDLLNQRATVTRLLHAHLEGTEEHAGTLYNIGGGRPLAQHPLVESALALLGSIHQSAHYGALQQLLADPALPGIYANNRLPQTCPEFLTLAQLPQSSAPEPLRIILRQISDWDDTHGKLRQLGDWWRDAASILRNARWHTARNDSEGFQATNALLDILISQAPHTDATLSWSDAYALLTSVTAQTLFAPASMPAPIQVLGYLEALELKFDHLWITSMDAESWPAVVANNPFLPPAELTRVNAPRTSYLSELEFAQNWLSRVTADLSECRASFVADEELPQDSSADSDKSDSVKTSQRVSPLLKDWPLLTEASEPAFHPMLTYWQQRQISLDTRLDIYGSKPESGTLRGAIRRLESQAACPMRGWGLYTLNLDEPIAPHSLPNALERGLLLHNAAQKLFQELPSSDALLKLDAKSREALCHRVALGQVEEELFRYAASIRRIETNRLNTALSTYIELESSRESFFVYATEFEIEGQLGPWQISLRIDRVDDVEGGQVVIDYKSTAPTLSKLQDDRLSAPQVPLYVLLLLAQGKTIQEINLDDPLVQAGTFAELKPDKAKYIGLRADDVTQGMPPKLNDKTPWRDVLIGWREKLLVLSSELEDGLAKPQPANTTVCTYCHLHGLCRYHLNYD